MLTIIGHVRVRPCRGDEFERLFRAYAARVKANEPGALVYMLNRSRSEAGVYKVIEIYRDDAALVEHRAAPYFQAAVEGMGACLEETPTTHVLDSVD